MDAMYTNLKKLHPSFYITLNYFYRKRKYGYICKPYNNKAKSWFPTEAQYSFNLYFWPLCIFALERPYLFTS